MLSAKFMYKKVVADVSAAFLHAALAATRPRGRVGFVMPQSYLASGDAKGARDAILARGALRSLWSCRETLFAGANVRVCAIVLERTTSRPRLVRRAFGADFHALKPTATPTRDHPTWSHLLADALGVPQCATAMDERATIESIAYATADFRDQYYGLRGCIIDREQGSEASHPQLIATRHVELAHSLWGHAPAKIHGTMFQHPRVDRVELERTTTLAPWVAARLIPKVLVATQTRVIEALVDSHGTLLPLVPLLTVTPRPRVDLWMLAAAIASPLVAARAVALYAGSALSSTAIKVSAKQLLAMPIPSQQRAWRESARHFKAASCAASVSTRESHLERFAVASLRAHELSESDAAAVMRFWNQRRNPSPRPRAKAPKNQTPAGAGAR